MTKQNLDNSASRLPGRSKSPRNSQWGRTSGREKEPAVAAADFIFDDQIIEGTRIPSASDLGPLHLDNPESPPESPGAAAAGGWSMDLVELTENSVPELPGSELQPRAAFTLRSLPPALWLLVAALALIGSGLVVVQRARIGFGQGEQKALQKPPAVAPEARTVAGDSRPAVPDPGSKRPVAPAVPASRVSRPSSVSRTAPPKRAAGRTRKKPAAGIQRAAVPVSAAPRVKNEEEAWFTQAEKYHQDGAPDRAETLYRRILRKGTQRGRAALALGDLFAEQGDYQSALQSYRDSERLYRAAAQPAAPP